MIVTRLTDGDLGACARIAAASFETPQFDLEEESRRAIALIWVARAQANGAAVAFLLAWGVADELHVLTVATDPAWRRRGLAKMLLDAALAHARATKVTRVLLEVRHDNHAARALYDGARFSVDHTRRGYYADGGDAVEMSLRLDADTGAILPPSDA